MPDDPISPEPQVVAAEPAELTSVAADSEPPEIIPPKTKAPVNFNQQNNFYQQIPTSAWDRLSTEQVVELSKQILKMSDDQDERHFQYAKERLNRTEVQNRRNLFLGSFVVLVGFCLTGYLAMNSHELVALTISLPLATIVAMLVGNRVLK
jgi:hypothetical protein